MGEAREPAEIYEEYFVPGNFARWVPQLLEHADPAPGERVLDVACGTGIVARHVAPLVGESGQVTGLDISPDMLEVARDLPAPDGAEIDWVEGDALELPDGPFDLVITQQGLQFVSDPAAVAREMVRVVRPGGRAVVSVWQELDRQSVYQALLAAEARHLGTAVDEVAGPAFSMGDPDELNALFGSAGWTTVEVVPASETVRFPSPDRFVTLTVLAAAAVLPMFAELDEAAREDLVREVKRDVQPVLDDHLEDGTVTFPMHANIVVART